MSVKLPEDLKFFYSNFGDGGAGPHYGILPIKRLSGYKPQLPYQGVEELRNIAFDFEPSSDEYFEVSHDEIQGLITIMNVGCGHEICLVSCSENNDEIGRVVNVSADGNVSETKKHYLKYIGNGSQKILLSLRRS